MRIPPHANAPALEQHHTLVSALKPVLARLNGVPRVAQIDTHISTILLAGTQAYKLKKPLALGFLDFSSLAARHHFLDEELRLNQRLAPQVYQAVRPLLGRLDAPRLGAPDDAQDAIEWLLQMRRFDPALGLDALARAGHLEATHIDALAQTLAHFHGGLAPAEPRFGSPDIALRWADDTFEHLRRLAAPTWTARLDALAQWTHARWQALYPTLRQRQAEGWVREGHGDLHLANIALIDGQPLPFDALEFNAELRCIDVVHDLAFPFMDLHAHGLPALAWRLVNGHVERSGDFAGLALLAWYAVQRALVRAKVALLSTPAGDAERYLHTAEALAQPAARQLWVVWGLSGSGKSSVALMLAEQLGALRLRSDVERKRLHGLRADERAADPATLYNPASTAATYARLNTLAGELLDAGLPVVVDAACLLRSERAALRAVAQQHRACCVMVECMAPPQVLAQRIRDRLAQGGDASDATPEVLALQQAVREAPDVQEHTDAVVLDTAASRSDVQARCIALVTQRCAALVAQRRAAPWVQDAAPATSSRQRGSPLGQ